MGSLLKIWKIIRRTLHLGFLLVIIYLNFYARTVDYALAQLKGQLDVIYGAQPASHFLENESYPDSLKQRILLVQEIRSYAIDSLGINYSDSYKDIYDQKGKPILWILTACEPYSMEPYEWDFPVAGKFSYKGFFEMDRLEDEKVKVEEEGLETGVREVKAWSTLGYLDDPILSNNLFLSEGDLANLIIHELTHGTIYVKNDVDYNENLASFIGDIGARKFLKQKYGADSEELSYYIKKQHDREKLTQHMLNGARKLDSLYSSFSSSLSVEIKSKLKKGMIADIIQKTDTIRLHFPLESRIYSKDFRPNNTYFQRFIRYESKQGEFRELFNGQFKGNFQDFFSYLKKKYPAL